MKKILSILVMILLVSGCVNKIECSKEEESDGVKVISKVSIKLKDDFANDINLTLKYDNEDVAKSMCEVFNKDENVKCSSKEIEFNNYQNNISDSLLTKEEVISYFELNGYKCN